MALRLRRLPVVPDHRDRLRPGRRRLRALRAAGLGVADARSLAMVVLTAGEILYKTTATAHVLDAAPDHLVGQYQGLYTGAATSGTMLAAPLGGDRSMPPRRACCGRCAAWSRWPRPPPSSRPGRAREWRRSDAGCAGSAKPGRDSVEDRPERRLGLELAEHADAAEPGAVDEQVRRRQVQLHRHRVRRLARVVDPLELCAASTPGRSGTARPWSARRTARGSRAAGRGSTFMLSLMKPSRAQPLDAAASSSSIGGDPDQRGPSPRAGRRRAAGPRRRSRARRAGPGAPSASGRIRKLPGCGSACSMPVRAGPANRNRTNSSP